MKHSVSTTKLQAYVFVVPTGAHGVSYIVSPNGGDRSPVDTLLCELIVEARKSGQPATHWIHLLCTLIRKDTENCVADELNLLNLRDRDHFTLLLSEEERRRDEETLEVDQLIRVEARKTHLFTKALVSGFSKGHWKIINQGEEGITESQHCIVVTVEKEGFY